MVRRRGGAGRRRHRQGRRHRPARSDEGRPVAPAPSRQPARRRRASTRIAEEPGGGLRIGADGRRWRRLAEHAACARAIRALAAARRSSASPQIRNVATLGRQPAAASALLVFPRRAYHCLRKGGGHCFAFAGENQYHAIFDNMAAPSSIPRPRRPRWSRLARRVEIADAAGRRRGGRAGGVLRAAGPGHRSARTICRPREILTAVDPAAAAAGRAVHGTSEAGREGVLRLAARRCRGGARRWRRRRCRQRRDRARRGGARAAPGKGREAALVGQAHRPKRWRGSAAHAALDGAAPLAKNAYKLPLFEALVRRAILSAAARRERLNSR